MPKIMFRPAPTPPPFVPPTPTYDTTVYAKSEPYPIQVGDEFNIKIMSANVPNFNMVILWLCHEPLEHTYEFTRFSMTNADFERYYDLEADYASDSEPYMSIEFFKDGNRVHEANLILSQA